MFYRFFSDSQNVNDELHSVSRRPPKIIGGGATLRDLLFFP